MKRTLISIALALASLTAHAQDHDLIGGTVVDQSLWAASPWIGNCSSTLLGPQVLLTAAHCVGNGGSRGFTLSGVRYSGTCEHHPAYASNYRADYAACILTAPVPIKAEVLAQPFEFPCATQSQVTWTGFGCTRWGQGIDGQFRIGRVGVVACPYQSNYYIVTQGSVALCSGDSGGGGYVTFSDGSRRVIGVNSRSNTTDMSWVSATHIPAFRDWLATLVVRHGVEVCGMNADPSVCRGTVSEPPPPPPPPPTRTVYRLFYAGAFDHLWSLNPNEGVPTYQLEGVAFKLFAEPGGGRSPLYRCFRGNTHGHFLSMDAGCNGVVWNEGVLGYVGTTGTRPLMRCRRNLSATRVHYLTTPNRAECDQSQHVFEGYQGYAAE